MHVPVCVADGVFEDVTEDHLRSRKRVFVTGRLRDMPALEKDPVNDRKGDLTGPWLETFD